MDTADISRSPSVATEPFDTSSLPQSPIAADKMIDPIMAKLHAQNDLGTEHRLRIGTTTIGNSRSTADIQLPTTDDFTAMFEITGGLHTLVGSRVFLGHRRVRLLDNTRYALGDGKLVWFGRQAFWYHIVDPPGSPEPPWRSAPGLAEAPFASTGELEGSLGLRIGLEELDSFGPRIGLEELDIFGLPPMLHCEDESDRAWSDSGEPATQKLSPVQFPRYESPLGLQPIGGLADTERAGFDTTPPRGSVDTPPGNSADTQYIGSIPMQFKGSSATTPIGSAATTPIGSTAIQSKDPAAAKPEDPIPTQPVSPSRLPSDSTANNYYLPAARFVYAPSRVVLTPFDQIPDMPRYPYDPQTNYLAQSSTQMTLPTQPDEPPQKKKKSRFPTPTFMSTRRHKQLVLQPSGSSSSRAKPLLTPISDGFPQEALISIPMIPQSARRYTGTPNRLPTQPRTPSAHDPFAVLETRSADTTPKEAGWISMDNIASGPPTRRGKKKKTLRESLSKLPGNKGPRAGMSRRASARLPTQPSNKKKTAEIAVVTGFQGASLTNALAQLAHQQIKVTENPLEATQCVRHGALGRTLKVLCAMARGIPIVTLAGEHLEDTETEREWNIKLSDTLARARVEPVFKNWCAFICARQPDPATIAVMIRAAGGHVLNENLDEQRVLLGNSSNNGWVLRVGVANGEWKPIEVDHLTSSSTEPDDDDDDDWGEGLDAAALRKRGQGRRMGRQTSAVLDAVQPATIIRDNDNNSNNNSAIVMDPEECSPSAMRSMLRAQTAKLNIPESAHLVVIDDVVGSQWAKHGIVVATPEQIIQSIIHCSLQFPV
ncbi:hypothetical protein GGI25_002515 [Coemansia spiralis]|uniref:BRCT domain-containing protein n=2 Tax=Coemansia TaxID=4863 RepID=A0A9W8KXB9_9FUNG|nr:hypothetical protein BX070DRAFT_255527 [Coemansia spiralis]KAJ1993041.1 hypothetical protein EDC05_002482 [Coemansia umbellata]KAJ2622921.1 hypothetical protein GGI26_002887 [Coemansia sp. RSA 1358]KAJ2678164.1 hypothetical protein GGI25_002515 [Coemansia spiralis]